MYIQNQKKQLHKPYISLLNNQENISYFTMSTSSLTNPFPVSHILQQLKGKQGREKCMCITQKLDDKWNCYSPSHKITKKRKKSRGFQVRKNVIFFSAFKPYWHILDISFHIPPITKRNTKVKFSISNFFPQVFCIDIRIWPRGYANASAYFSQRILKLEVKKVFPPYLVTWRTETSPSCQGSNDLFVGPSVSGPAVPA